MRSRIEIRRGELLVSSEQGGLGIEVYAGRRQGGRSNECRVVAVYSEFDSRPTMTVCKNDLIGGTWRTMETANWSFVRAE